MKQRILVDMDALLDTRLGVLMQMDHGETALTLGYRTRTSDRWAEMGLTVDQADYDRRYQARDVMTLAASRPTNVAYLLNQITEYLSQLRLNAPMYETCEVIINTYPYHLDDETQKAICLSVGSWISMESSVSCIRRSAREVSPSWLLENAEGYVVYDFNHWLTQNEKALGSTRLPRNLILAPSLYWNETPESDQVEVDELGKVNPFAALELALVEYLGLHFQPVAYFSLIEF